MRPVDAPSRRRSQMASTSSPTATPSIRKNHRNSVCDGGEVGELPPRRDLLGDRLEPAVEAAPRPGGRGSSRPARRWKTGSIDHALGRSRRCRPSRGAPTSGAARRRQPAAPAPGSPGGATAASRTRGRGRRRGPGGRSGRARPARPPRSTPSAAGAGRRGARRGRRTRRSTAAGRRHRSRPSP